MFRHLFVPTLLVFATVGWWQRDAIHTATHLDASLVIFTGTMLIIFVAEQFFPARSEWNYGFTTNGVRAMQRFSRDFVYVMFVTVLSVLAIHFVAAPIEALTLNVSLWPTSAPAPLRIALAFLVMEVGNYGFHRLAHRVPILWRFHATHHVITELTGVKSLRTHPIDNVLFHLVRTVPLLMLGASADDLAAATYFGAVLGILSHANLELAHAPLGWFINFPRFHAVHHAEDATRAQKNFGCHTVVFDRLFGTFDDGADQPQTLGVTTKEPRSLWRELFDAR
ncbi:MAG: sterol desaturase family protein [Archangium sp.]